MRHATIFFGIAFLMIKMAIGAQFTNNRTNQGRIITLQISSMDKEESAFKYCRRVRTDDQPGDVPASLAPAFSRVFGVKMTPTEIQRNSRFRCYRGRVMGCMVGANLNCGRADDSKTSQGGNEWCRAHPNDTMIPMAATGHATIYSWHCSGDRAVPAKVISKVDSRGFEAINWKPLD
jgi:hypothetical protein